MYVVCKAVLAPTQTICVSVVAQTQQDYVGTTQLTVPVLLVGVCVPKAVVAVQVYVQQHHQLGVVFSPTDSVVHKVPVLITAD
jgi:hypothetical protein